MTLASTPPRAATAIKGLDLFGCTVSDVDRSVSFYRDKLGITPAAVYPQGAEFIFPDGGTIGIWKPEAGTYEDIKPGFGVMFAVDDCRAAVEQFRARGAKIADPFETPACIMALGSDCEGNGFVVHQRKSHDDPPAPPLTQTPASINGVDLAAFLVGDAQRAIAFYRDVMGMTPTEIDEQGRGAEFTLADGQTFGVWHSEDGPSSGGAMMLSVRDVNAAVSELRARGVEVSDPQDEGACYMAFTSDPDGIALIVHQRK
jgi:lactoylglutathione lyase